MSRRLRVGTALAYRGRPGEAADVVADHARAGAQLVSVSEVWGFDAVSLLGYLAARAPGVELASNTLPLYTRTPALLAMTAAGLDALTGGRFTLGLGASGPQVVEGLHGVPHDAPVARTREVVEICRALWRGQVLEHQGRHYSAPLATDRGGSGLGTPLALLNTPVRERVPVAIAALGPRNTGLAAEVAEQWAPFLFRPESALEVWGGPVAAGMARRDPALGPLEVTVTTRAAVGESTDQHVVRALAEHRSTLALYLGGMGARDRNFYADLGRRYGFAAEVDAVQERFLAGRRREAAAAVPDELVTSTALVGPRGQVAERLAAMAQVGVTSVVVEPSGVDHRSRVAAVEALADLARSVVLPDVPDLPTRPNSATRATGPVQPADDLRGEP